MVGSAHEQHLAQQVLQWLSVCSKVQLFAYGPANAIASPSSRLIKIQNGLPFWYWLPYTSCLRKEVIK